jgi:hypothetical protein
MTVNPFSSYNTGSGTLNSVTIRWNTNWSFSGTTGAVGGSANLNNGGGNSYVGSISYGGNGGGNGGGAAPYSPLSFTATWAGTNPADYVFVLPYQGGYNPAIAAIFTGSSPFTVAYGFGNNAQGGFGGLGELAYSDIASGRATVSSDVTVKYSYFGEQVPVPVPATLALLGLGLAGIGAARRSTSPR